MWPGRGEALAAFVLNLPWQLPRHLFQKQAREGDSLRMEEVVSEKVKEWYTPLKWSIDV